MSRTTRIQRLKENYLRPECMRILQKIAQATGTEAVFDAELTAIATEKEDANEVRRQARVATEPLTSR